MAECCTITFEVVLSSYVCVCYFLLLVYNFTWVVKLDVALGCKA